MVYSPVSPAYAPSGGAPAYVPTSPAYTPPAAEAPSLDSGGVENMPPPPLYQTYDPNPPADAGDGADAGTDVGADAGADVSADVGVDVSAGVSADVSADVGADNV